MNQIPERKEDTTKNKSRANFNLLLTVLFHLFRYTLYDGINAKLRRQKFRKRVDNRIYIKNKFVVQLLNYYLFLNKIPPPPPTPTKKNN